MKNLDLDKALTRLKKSAEANKKLVDEDSKRIVGTNKHKQMKRQEELDAAQIQEGQQNNAILRALNEQINKTTEGSKEEADLLQRRKRISRQLGRY